MGLFARFCSHTVLTRAGRHKALQVTGGHWNHIVSFRSELSACMDAVWRYISSSPPGAVALPEACLRELFEAIVLAPLAQYV